MDLLLQHEAFLRAIFAAPDDDTPRLVYADFLEENGKPERAALIRAQCELAKLGSDGEAHERVTKLRKRENELLDCLHPELAYWTRTEREQIGYCRGFLSEGTAVICPGDLERIDQFREKIIRSHPHWFNAHNLAIQPGWFLHSEHIKALFSLAVVQRITEWDLGGQVQEIGMLPSGVNTQPVISLASVEALAEHPGSEQLTTLNLNHNNLDHRAAQALIRSPYLNNLRRLTILAGNDFSNLWQLIERFGVNVVG